MSCLLYHDWGIWIQYNESFMESPNWGPNKGRWFSVIEHWQKRKCNDCGKEEREKI